MKNFFRSHLVPHALKTPFWLYVISLVPSAILVAIVAAQPWVPPSQLFRDPLSVAADAGSDCCHIYFGFVSNLGMLLWCSAATVCLFASVLLIHRKADRRQVLFMVYAGLFTGLLMFDDLFLAHEVIFPKVFGADEKHVLAAYMILMCIYLLFFRDLIFRSGYSLMLLSLIFFAISVFVDLFVSEQGSLHRIGEDGTKFIGIATWTAFHVRAAWLLCTGNQDLEPRRQSWTLKG